MVSLIHDPVVIRQIIQVHLIKLRKLQIYESSSLCRPVLDNVQIFRREKYKIHNSEKFACFPDRDLVNRNPFRTVLLQVHIDLITDSVLFHHGFDVGFILAETDHIPVLRPAVGLGRSGQIHSLQNIRLPLGIVPVKNIRRTIKLHIQKIIISKIL